jgi:hypothetical protein
MDQIICLLPLIPMRSEPNHRSEMVSQMLFGEKAVITGFHKEWIEIKTHFDQYQGWVEYRSVRPYDLERSSSEWTLTRKPITTIKKAKSSFLVSTGSEIPTPDKSNRFIMNSETYLLVDDYERSVQNPLNMLIDMAVELLNVPYLWGGRSVFGMDCSGFTQILFKNIGINLPRDAKDQADKGISVGSVKECLPGDLLFFQNDEGSIIHTGIFLPENNIIHASVYVRIDKIDDKGVFNENEKRYTHNLRSIRRIIKL